MELSKSIKGNYDSFVYYKRDNDGIVREYPCDTASIRRQIRFCIRLNLIGSEDNCSLTDKGINARLPGRFGLQLQQAVISYLDNNGLKLKEINSAIDKLVLPHTAMLYQYLAPALSEDIFRTCLFLLCECGQDENQNVLISFDKKLYLTNSKIEKAQKSMEEK